jgi:hypothetical protein
MGDTLRYAERMKLVEMEPRGDLSSTGYVLANPGEEYLILQPNETAEPFTVTLAAGTYAVEWFSVDARQTREADRVMVASDGSVDFTAPFAEAHPAVLYLKRSGRSMGQATVYASTLAEAVLSRPALSNSLIVRNR